MEVSRRSIVCLTNAGFCGSVLSCRVGVSRTSRGAALLKRHPIQTRGFRTATALSQEVRRHEESLAPPPTRGTSKLFKNADEAVADLKSGSVILSAGFGLCGTAGMCRCSLVGLRFYSRSHRDHHHRHVPSRSRLVALADCRFEQCWRIWRRRIIASYPCGTSDQVHSFVSGE
jgi:hypothetical protein